MTELLDFSVLQNLSLARTALDDPASLPETYIPATPALQRDYAVEKIDETIGALLFEPANDSAGELVWVLTNIGRLLAEVCDGADAEFENAELTLAIRTAGDQIDDAINAASNGYIGDCEQCNEPGVDIRFKGSDGRSVCDACRQAS